MALDERIALVAPAAYPETWKAEIHYYTTDAAGLVYAAPHDVVSLLRQGFRLHDPTAAAATPDQPIYAPAVGSVAGEPPTAYPSPAPVAETPPAPEQTPPVVETPAETPATTEATADGELSGAVAASDPGETGPVFN